MHYLLKSLLALALTPALGHAAYSLENINAHCSDALTISQGAGVSFQCLGNFSLTGDGDAARLWSDRSITLSATGDLRLNDLRIVAPQIQLLASHVTMDQDAALISQGGSVLIDARGSGSVALQQGSTIDVSAGTITMAAHSNRTPWGSAGQVSLPSRSGALMLSNASGIHLQSSFPGIVGHTLSVASGASTRQSRARTRGRRWINRSSSRRTKHRSLARATFPFPFGPRRMWRIA